MLLRLTKYVAAKVFGLPLRRQLRAFLAATHEPRKHQDKLFKKIIGRNKKTAFGRDHRFADIRSLADFRRQVPVAGYDYVDPYIQRVCRGETDALLSEDKILMFALTSGTTASRKLIPVTKSYLKSYRLGWNVWGAKSFRDHTPIKFTPIVQFSGDADEYRTEAGIPCGSVTGLTASMQKRLIRRLYCVPGCVGRVKDAASKYYLTLRLSMARSVGLVIAANPSTLINLARIGDREREKLLRDLHDGTLDRSCLVTDEVRRELEPALRRRHPQRVRELEEVIRRAGTLYPKDYWPAHCLLGNWTGGSVGTYLRHYPTYFGDMPVRDVGLIASEGRMSIPLDDGSASGVLDITNHFFEFVPEDEIDSPHPTVLSAHEVREGRNYYILPTTSYGLYRYHISDVVRVTGFYNATPLVEFLSKGANFANLTGEKLSEHHVTQAMRDVLRQHNLTISTYSVAPCWDDELPYYGLFIEAGDLEAEQSGLRLAAALDERLAQVNIEYASKRDSLRLGALRLVMLPEGAWSQWDRQRLAKTGGTLEQYKHPCLIADLKFRESMPVKRELSYAAGQERHF